MNRKVVAELVLSPIVKGEVGISHLLREVLHLLKTNYPNLKVETHAMGTNIECEGGVEELLAAVRLCHDYLVVEKKVPRVVTTLKIDERTDNPDHTMEGKVRRTSF